MAINVGVANNQAAQINDNISKLRDAKRQMLAYRSSVSNNWQGKEVTYILTAIDRVIGDIDSVTRNLDSLSGDIKNVAAQIKREEDAAAAAAQARAEKERQIKAAQTAYNDAVDEYDAVAKEMDELQKALKKNPLLQFHPDFAKRFNKLKEDLEKATQKCDDCKKTLTSVRGW